VTLPAVLDRFVIENVDGLMVAENKRPSPGTQNFGYRRFVWTRKTSEAMQWFSLDGAIKFRDTWLMGEWRIRPVVAAETTQPAVV
jgi:hypothetical protein